MRISDWSSDVCSSDLHPERAHRRRQRPAARRRFALEGGGRGPARRHQGEGDRHRRHRAEGRAGLMAFSSLRDFIDRLERAGRLQRVSAPVSPALETTEIQTRLLAEGGPSSEEHTSELQSIMRNSYAVFCLKNKNKNKSPNL